MDTHATVNHLAGWKEIDVKRMAEKDACYDSNIFHAFYHPEKNVQIHLVPTIYGGIRIKAGIYKDVTYFLDWCCGQDQARLRTLLFKLLIILNGQPYKGYEAFAGLPTFSDPKPYWKDDAFCKKVDDMFNDVFLKSIP